MAPGPRVDWSAFDAVLFDLDGVLTDTAAAHAAAWKRTFDAFLAERAVRTGERPFDDEDYRRYVDGRPRYDGVVSFLASRGIALPKGDPTDPPDAETVCGLGNRKNAVLLAFLEEHGVQPFPGSVALLRSLSGQGVRLAVVSASANCEAVLHAAGLNGFFEARVDGIVAAERGLHGKPAPDSFLEAARRLGVDPAHAVVVEDAVSGVEAGRSGGFGLVVGVDRRSDPRPLLEAGADLVVSDLAELL